MRKRRERQVAKDTAGHTLESLLAASLENTDTRRNVEGRLIEAGSGRFRAMPEAL